MRKTLLSAAILALFTGAQILHAQQTKSEEKVKVANFEIDDYKGKTVKLSDYSGKVLIIHHMLPG